MATQDLKEQTAVREKVREGYSKIARAGSSERMETGCCGPGAAQETAQAVGYSEAELATLPEGANMGLSCGNPTALAELKPGEIVVDLGSGGGFDVFLAGQKVGPEGRAIGVDMTPDMLDKARRNTETYRDRTGLDNVEFRLGEIEHLPLPDNSADAVISNCVINLSPDKAAVFREAFRVLRPGGRVAVSDIVLTAPLPEAIADSIAAYVGCVAGASLLDDYIGFLRDAGFEDIKVAETRKAVESLAEDDPIVLSVLEGTGASSYEDLATEIRGVAGRVLSAKITARKP